MDTSKNRISRRVRETQARRSQLFLLADEIVTRSRRLFVDAIGVYAAIGLIFGQIIA